MSALGSDKKRVLLLFFYAIGVVYLIRLFYVQVIDDQYVLSAENQSLRYVNKYAPRGLIFDRNGSKLVYNEPLYDLLLIPRLLKPTFDTIKFCQLFSLERKDFDKKVKKAKKFSRYKPSVFLSNMTVKEYAPVMEKMYLFPEFELRLRDHRKVAKGIAAHVIGHVGEVGKKDIANDSTYQIGDYIGKNGVEKMYEKQLRGNHMPKVLKINRPLKDRI